MSAPIHPAEKTEAVHYDQPETEESKTKGLLGNTAPKDGDLGSRWLATYTGPRPELTDELNNQIRNRIDWNLLPLIFLIYFNQQLDKSAVAFAAVFNFRQDAGLVGQEYAMLTTIIYIAQLIFQPRKPRTLARADSSLRLRSGQVQGQRLDHLLFRWMVGILHDHGLFQVVPRTCRF